MGLFGRLVGGTAGAAAGSVVKDVAGGIGTLAKDIRTAITGVDPEKAAELEKLAIEAERVAMSAQVEINKLEAQSPRFFVAGWRPAVGWLCVLAFGMQYVVHPVAQWVLVARGSGLVLPDLDMATMMPVLIGMLGIGAFRTYEKAKGVNSAH